MSCVESSPVSGVKERIEGMLRRYGQLTEEVGRLEALVDDQRKDLEMQNSSRFGGIYDDVDEGSVITQTMVDEEEEKVRQLEEKIKSMQEKVIPLKDAANYRFRSWMGELLAYNRIYKLSNLKYVYRFLTVHCYDFYVRIFIDQLLVFTPYSFVAFKQSAT